MKLHTRPGHYRVDTTQRVTMEGPYHPRRLRSLRITLVVMVCAVVALPFVVTAIVLLCVR
mgnify:CR=1 FL=1